MLRALRSGRILIDKSEPGSSSLLPKVVSALNELEKDCRVQLTHEGESLGQIPRWIV